MSSPLKVYVFQDEGKSSRPPANNRNRNRPNTINLGQELRAQRVSGRVNIQTEILRFYVA